MLDVGIVTTDSSAWYFPVVIVSRKDKKKRFCVYYAALNQRMKPDHWTIPKIPEIFDEVEGRNYSPPWANSEGIFSSV